MIYVANYEPNRLGGGWSFARNFVKGMGDNIGSYEESDIYFITSASMVQRDEVQRAVQDGKRVVLRIDNAIRNSNNRNTGMTRLKDFAGWADLVIYQSAWARDFLKPFTNRDGAVILNGVDTTIFNTDNRIAPEDSYLYVRSSRDEGKQWIMAWYWFVNNPGHLSIVGKFSHENLEHNFDFYNDENYTFLGEQTRMEDVYKRNKYFLYTYLNDACSNTLLEAKACGCEIVDVYGMLRTGGAREIMECKDVSLERMIEEYKVVLNVK